MATGTNYVPGLVGPAPTTIFAGGDLHSGSGAPSDSLGSNGDAYIDSASGSLYTKSGGVWSAVSTGTGSANMSGVGSPIGVVIPTAINIWYRDTVGNGWYWSIGLTSADWIQVV